MLPPLTPQRKGLSAAGTSYSRQTSGAKATPRSARALTKKLQGMLKKQQLNSKTAKFYNADQQEVPFPSTSPTLRQCIVVT